MRLFIFSLIFLSKVTFSQGQSELKQTKQQTNFFYTQLNLHGGYIHDSNGDKFDLTNRGPKTQLAFQYFTKSKKNLQKGYVKSISLNSAKFRFSIPLDKKYNSSGETANRFQLTILDTWLKFSTKWDRTFLWVGNKSIPYGHNPKLDPVSSFMTNIIKMDIGFVQDLGLFLKTPISNNLDMELAITSGGFLNKPLLLMEQSDFSSSKYNYDNTWLITSHIGSPTFKKNEYGINLVSGKIRNILRQDDFVQINRIGVDWIHKSQETFIIANELTFGHSKSDFEGGFASLNSQSSIGFFIKNKVFIDTSFATNYLNSTNSRLYYLNYTSATSLTYSFSPHTRLRLNGYYTNIMNANEEKWGALLQFVIGIGKRP
jgi:hypothetical protein